MFPKRACDQLLTMWTFTRCPVKIINITKVKELQKEVNYLRRSRVSKLGHGCTLTDNRFLGPTGLITSDEFSPTKISKCANALHGGAQTSGLNICLATEHNTFLNPLVFRRSDWRRS
jgi:hypothetical protein